MGVPSLDVMPEAFACVVYPTSRVSERALSRGFAVALAGFDVPAPAVVTAELRGIPGWSVAFYRSGLKLPRFEEHDHACDLFEEELPPGLAVRDAAAAPDVVVYALVYSDEVTHDDAWRFGERSVVRRFVCEGDEGLEAGDETLDESSVEPISVPHDAQDDALEAALRPRRGSTYLCAELGAPVLPAIVAALFDADQKVNVRLVDPSAASIGEETQRLNRVLGRVDGRGAPAFPGALGGAPRPAAHEAFSAVYDFEDPSDATDLYRGVAIGRLDGTLHFLRPRELEREDLRAGLAALAGAGAYPIAVLSPSALGGGAARVKRAIGLCADGERLVLAELDRTLQEAGPTFGELLFYLSLGFKSRDDVEEDLIGALMLKAKLRSG